MTRKLATVRRIDAVNAIPGADAIEVATVGGWRVVVQKGAFAVGDLAVYCEIDSWVPTRLAPFLSKGKEPKEYNGVKGERLRTIRLRGQLSQGLLLPLEVCIGHLPVAVGDDVSDVLGIQKWEAPIPAQLAGISKGSFPSFIHKTDQERIQNLTRQLSVWAHEEDSGDPDWYWEVTEKLDGSSMTAYINDGVFGVCSRNIELERTENNAFWRAAISCGLEYNMRALSALGYNNFAVQGELVGEGIQGNPYGLSGQQLFIYDWYSIDDQEYMSNETLQEWVYRVGLRYVPVLSNSMCLRGVPIEGLLAWAEGKSALNIAVEREGLVFKRYLHGAVIQGTETRASFKVISNRFLMGEK